MNSDLKLLSSFLGGYALWTFVDGKLVLSHDLALARRMLPSVLTALKLGKQPGYCVTVLWYRCLNTILGEKAKTKPMLIEAETGRQFTFAQVEALSNQIANWAASVFKPGSCVALYMENKPEYVITWLGLTKAGLEIAMINSNIKSKALVHSVVISSAVGLIYDTELSANVANVAAELADKGVTRIFDSGANRDATIPGSESLDQAFPRFPSTPVDPKRREHIKSAEQTFGYIYTSGTTGLPKACKISHMKLTGYSLASAAFEIRPDDVIYGSGMPLYHTAANLGIGASLRQGNTYIVRKKFSARNHWEECARYKATVMQYIGELCRYLLAAPERAAEKSHCVRLAMGNGLRPEIWNTFQRRMKIPEIGEFYGATEGNAATFNLCRNYEGQGAVGRSGWLFNKIRPMYIVKFDIESEMPIRDKKTGFCIPCDTNEPGELIAPIKMVPTATGMAPDFEGYTSKEATEKKILRDVFKKGDAYFRTGDLLRKDAKGYMYFVDRIGDTFRWKGENVSTMEVSEIVSSFPGILEASVYGVEVPGKDGRACMVGLVLEEGATIDPNKLATYCRSNLPAYSIPMFIRFLSNMDSTGTFKHKKTEYRKEGCNPSKITDKLWWYNPSKGTYEPYGPEQYQQITAGRAKL